MKKQLERMIQTALRHLLDQQELVAMPAFIQIEASKEKAFGDFSTNIALILARTSHHAPYKIAERLVAAMPPSPLIEKIDICQPGFINFFLKPNAYQELIATILSEKTDYGCCKIGRAKKVLVEFVSAPPIKPLYHHHARLAVFGSTIARLLSAVGFQVATEYYVDNVGLAVQTFAIEVWRAYLLVLANVAVDQALFATQIASLLRQQMGEQFYRSDVDTNQLLLTEQTTHTVLAYVTSVLGDDFKALQRAVTEIVQQQHQADLTSLGITFDFWVDAQSLLAAHTLNKVLSRLAAKGALYQQDGGYWFHAEQFGDERDRVLIRPDGDYTHLAYELAYHLNKFERGFDLAIDIFDFNPIDYSAGIQAGLQALGYDPEQLMSFYVQPLHVLRADQEQELSLPQLQEVYSKDELHFQLLTKRACQAIELSFDADSVGDHLLSYVQYAAVRIQTIFNELKARELTFIQEEGVATVHQLVLEEERLLLNTLASYSETLVHAALQYEPHIIVHYLRILAAEFHAYYNAHTILVDDPLLRSARLALIKAVHQLLINGCALLGVSLPKTM